MSSSTLTVDQKGVILTWSDAAERLLGYTSADAVGQPVELIIPAQLRRPHSTGFQRYVQTGQSKLPEVVTTSALHKNGRIVRLKISVKAVRGQHGDIIAVDATMNH